MRLNIRIKMFLVLLLSNIAIIVSMYVFFFVSLESGFNEYVDEIERQQFQRLSLKLGELYQSKMSFAFLHHDEKIVSVLENLLFDDELYLSEDGIVFDAEEGSRETSLFFVLDSDKKIITGAWDKGNDEPMWPIRVADNVVGWVGFSNMNDPIYGTEFIESQNSDYLIITAITLVFSALFAMGAAYYFEKPIKALARGTKALTSGSYDTRVTVTSVDEIGDLTQDFNSLADTLEENENSRRKWVEDISHELKTPLTLLAGELEAVQDGIRPLTITTIKVLSDDVAHLGALVNDLNDLWQTETGVMSFNKVSISLLPILQHSLEKFKTQYREKGISLKLHREIEEDLIVDGDTRRLIQLYDNLLQNSLRYTDTGGSVLFTLSKKQNLAIIGLQDSEPGINPADFDRIFDRLYRGEPSRNREFGGAGIGLTVCKNIVNAHGGTIRAQRSPMGGLALDITLPLS